MGRRMTFDEANRIAIYEFEIIREIREYKKKYGEISAEQIDKIKMKYARGREAWEANGD